ncbi:Mur ligase [Cephaloticoccus primus]|uniref:Mur ligase n=1 Tax=Cephaloticoccus primus TaxID=1548207 RepID=A0A139SLQ1_9BACT|nr:Mur ligase domain-containing protein [Cephaloticoccus primus]KXU35414.1 Mur ligase [Cephaloticoccus primus]
MRIYFMGICGTAMGNAALLARASGHEVLGSDAGIYPPMSEVLREAGIPIYEGYDAARLEGLAPDLVVVGNAQSRGNPEVEWLLDTRKLAYTSLPAWLAEFILKGRRPVVICGTHGKTTTTALTAFLLRGQAAGKRERAETCVGEFDPGFLIGGVPLDPPVGQHLGSAGAPFVIEGDEYDSAFFDKRSKFVHYAPQVAVLGNLEFDHADIFRDLADVQRSFRHLTRLVPRSGWVVLNGDDENLAALGPMPWTRVVRVGQCASCEVRIVDFEEDAAGAQFSLLWKGAPWGQRVHWAQPGLFNARNAAMAATAAALATVPDSPARLDLSPLTRFRGVRRRQELRVNLPALKVIEDFGHHPTALGETLRSLRARYPEHAVYAAFEPRSNTARTSVLLDGFIAALAQADGVYLGAVAESRIAGEARFDTARVIAELAAKGVRAQTAAANAELLARMKAELLDSSPNPLTATRAETGGPRLLAFFTSGSFDGIIADFVEAAKASRCCAVQ